MNKGNKNEEIEVKENHEILSDNILDEINKTSSSAFLTVLWFRSFDPDNLIELLGERREADNYTKVV